MANEPEFTLEELLAQDDWLRNFVRRLLRSGPDESLVDDIVQDVWTVVIQKPWASVKKPRSWLAAIARNKAYGSFRGSDEAKGISASADLSFLTSESELPEEMLAREELRMRLIRAVQALEEPYRTVLLLRFYSGLSFRQIARRRGVPVSTARIQAYRGRQKLREKLEEKEFRGESLWAALPMLANPWVPAGLGSPGSTGSTEASAGSRATEVASRTPGGLTGPAAIGLAVTGLAALVVVGWIVGRWEGDRRPGNAERAEPAELDVAIAPPTPLDVPGGAGEEAAPRTGALLDERVTAGVSRVAEDWTLSGRVHLGSPHRSERLFEGGVPVQLLLYPGYDTSGDPIGEATVLSGGDGSFRFSRPVPEIAVTARVRVAARPGESYAPHRQSERIARIPAGEPPPADLALAVFPRDMTLRVRVVDASGDPVPNATVAYLRELAATNEQGLASVHVSSYDEIVELDCWADGAAVRTERLATRGADRTEYTIRLDPGVRLEVLVTDAETGTALEGVSVSIDRHPVLVTDARGRCVFHHLRAGQEATIVAQHPDYARTARRRSVSAQDGQTEEMELVRGWDVAVEVVDGSGLPVPGAESTLGFADTDPGRLVGFTDERGALGFRAVRPRGQELLVARDGFAPVLVPVEGPGLLRVTLDDGRPPVRIRVRTETGMAVGRAKVEMMLAGWAVGRTYWTAPDGEVVLEPFPAGEVSVWVSGAGIFPEEFPIDGNADVEVRRTYSFTGIVQDARTGARIERFLVRFVEPESDEREAAGFGAAWRDGHEFFDGEFSSKGEALRSGRLRLAVSAEGYETSFRALDLEGPLTSVDLVIELNEAGRR